MLKPHLDRAERLFKTDVRYLLREGSWLSGGQGVSSVIALLMAIAFANLVSPTAYGGYKYLLSFSGLLAIFTLSGLNTAVTQATARGLDGSVWTAFKYRLQGGFFLTLLGLIISGYYYLAGNNWLSAGFLLISLFTPFMESAIIYTSVLSGKRLFRLSATYNVISQFIASLIIFITINLTNEVWIILLSYLASYAGLNLFFLLKVTREQVKNNDIDPETIKFGLRLSGVNVLASVANYLDSIILWHFLGPIQVATYTFAQATITPSKTLLKSFFNLAMPKFAARDLKEIKKTLPAKMLKAFGLVILPVIILILIIPIVFQLFFPAYLASIPYAQVLALTLIFFPEKLMGIMFTAQMKEKQLYTLNIVNPLIKIILILILIPLYGLWGAVWAILIQQVLASCLSLYLFQQLPLNPPTAPLAPTSK